MRYQSETKEAAEIDLMLKLSFVAYAGCYNIGSLAVDWAVQRMVKKLLPGQAMAWGPESSGNIFDLFTTTVAFIVKDQAAAAAGESIYTVVIRGTNALSWSSVVVQDLAVHDMTPWKLVSPKAEIGPDGDPSIYVGAGRTLGYLNKLKHHGTTMVDFLAEKVKSENASIRVTGHSLGGMATMMYAVWLQDEFKGRGLDITGRFGAWPVAGLTPGNKDFASYTEAIFADNKNHYLRIVNDLDFATKAWVQRSLGTQVPTMYDPAVTLEDLDRSIIKLFYNIALNRNYAHAENHMLIPSRLAPIKSWFLQFIYQHMVPYLDYLREPADREALLTMLGLEMMKRDPIGTGRIVLATKKKRASEKVEQTAAVAA